MVMMMVIYIIIITIYISLFIILTLCIILCKFTEYNNVNNYIISSPSSVIVIYYNEWVLRCHDQQCHDQGPARLPW